MFTGSLAGMVLEEEGIACGYCEGAAGLGRRPELFVNG